MELSVSEVTSILSRTPATLRALLGDLPAVWLEADEGEGTFSPRDVVGYVSHELQRCLDLKPLPDSRGCPNAGCRVC